MVDQPTDAFERNAKLTAPTNGKDGRQWALRVTKLDSKAYRALQVNFDPKIPAAVTTRPDFLFIP